MLETTTHTLQKYNPPNTIAFGVQINAWSVSSFLGDDYFYILYKTTNFGTGFYFDVLGTSTLTIIHTK